MFKNLNDSAFPSYRFEFVISLKMPISTQKLNFQINSSANEHAYTERVKYSTALVYFSIRTNSSLESGERRSRHVKAWLNPENRYKSTLSISL